jgi:hypothetical protein
MSLLYAAQNGIIRSEYEKCEKWKYLGKKLWGRKPPKPARLLADKE